MAVDHEAAQALEEETYLITIYPASYAKDFYKQKLSEKGIPVAFVASKIEAFVDESYAAGIYMMKIDDAHAKVKAAVSSGSKVEWNPEDKVFKPKE